MTYSEGPGTTLRCWQTRIFNLLWGGYAAYYFCRVNFAVAQPQILKEFPSWSAADLGSIPSSFALAYGAGQIVNGILASRFGTRSLMTFGLLIAASTNVLFSVADSLLEMQLFWALNGWGQSAGWALMVQTLSEWNTSSRRATLIGRLSTSYQVGHVLSWLLTGFLCERIGWRSAFLIPGLAVVPFAFIFFRFLRNSPTEAGFAPVRDDVAAKTRTDVALNMTESLWTIVKLTLTSRILWILTIAFFVMNTVRYSFLNWSVQYMSDHQNRGIQGSVLTAILIPLMGAAGALAAGWLSDRFFQKRRAPVCVFMLLGVTATCAALGALPKGEWQAAAILMGIAGFMIYGPDVLVAGAATVDFSHPKSASIATGLTMSAGAAGTIFSGAGIGYLKDFAGGNWLFVFDLLAVISVLPAALMALLWNAKPKAH